MKRIGIIGRGTAGAMAVTHITRWMPEYEINWYFDPNIPTKPVGEGTNLVLPRTLANNMGFTHLDLDKVDGSFKLGIYKENWGHGHGPFFHDFIPPFVAWHFDARKLQDLIFSRFNKITKIHEGSFSPDDVDCDYVMDCTGKPSDLSTYETETNMVLNAVYVAHCEWEKPEFQYTLTIAKQYGWAFGIPLQSRCSIGYMYNTNFNTIDEVKEDIKSILEEYGLKQTREAAFTFDNYYKKQNFTDRVCYNGDKSFFLEPLEATSTATIDKINRSMYDVVYKNITVEQANNDYHSIINEIADMISLHYLAGSPFKTPFWEYAQNEAEKRYSKSLKKENFRTMLYQALSARNFYYSIAENGWDYGAWPVSSWHQNIHGLELSDKLLKMMKEHH